MTRTSQRTLTTAKALIDAGLATPERLEELEAVGRRYAVAIPPALAALIDTSDADDPIARQFVPDARELIRTPAERDDPIGDHLKSPVRGLVHRYPDRVLLKMVSVCLSMSKYTKATRISVNSNCRHSRCPYTLACARCN